MPRQLSIALWCLVFIMGVAIFWLKSNSNANNSQKVKLEPIEESGTSTASDGRVLVDIPWDHLPSVDRFEMTDQAGNTLNTATLHNRPYVVSFFFASCPSFCRDLNNELDRVNKLLQKTDIQFLTITVDPDRDSQKVLSDYAAGYDARPDRWAFLRGSHAERKRIGQRIFDVVVDRDTHTDSIILVDKWGRYRDRFKWDQPADMKRFLEVAQKVAAETEPPLGQIVRTRNVMAGVEAENLGSRPWLRDFHLKDPQGKKFFSRDMTGEVWLARFGNMDPATAKQVQAWQESIQQETQKNVRWISIGTGVPANYEMDLQGISCFQSEAVKVRRIVRECFGLRSLFESEGLSPSLSSTVMLMDRWCGVRGRFDLKKPSDYSKLIQRIGELSNETIPPAPTFGFTLD